MRRKEREMDKDFAFKIIDKSEYGFLATTKDNIPYCTPLSIVRENNFIYFHCAHEGRKIENMRANPKVCMSFVGDTNIIQEKIITEYESTIISGTATEITERAEKIRALELLCLRQIPDNMHRFEAEIERAFERTAVWKVEIEEIAGKRIKYDQDGVEMKFGRME